MTNTSRRNLLRAGIFGTVLATLVPVRNAAAATTTELYSRSRFKRRVTSSFRLSNATATWSVTLDGISDVLGAPKGADNAFALTFSSSAGVPPQGTYKLVRSGFEPTQLFVVPGDPARRSLHAVINRTA